MSTTPDCKIIDHQRLIDSYDKGLALAPRCTLLLATKAAIMAFTKALAMEVGSHGIRAIAIAPGVVETMTNRAFDEGPAAVEAPSKEVALGRFGRECQSGGISSSNQSRYANGTVVEINGGLR